MPDLRNAYRIRPQFSPADVAAACERIVGQKPDSIEDMTDLKRKSIGVHFRDRRVIVSRRDSDARAALEAHVLRTLHARGAPVPSLLGIKGRWLIQESVGEVRLSTALRRLPPGDRPQWLDAALSSLAGIHETARSAGLDREIYRIGATDGWLDRFMTTPRRIGDFLSLPPPALDTDALRKRLEVREPAFVKWDARPPNAMPQRDGSVAWFDWEHCGCRNPLDDVAWLLGDESVPEEPEAEDALIGRHLANFGGGMARGEAELYLRAFGALHISVRLSITISDMADEGEPAAAGLPADGAGARPGTAQRLCRRGARWAAQAPETAPLSAWFIAIGNRLGSE